MQWPSPATGQLPDTTMKRRLIGFAKAVAWLAVTLASLLALRTFLAPDWHEPPEVALQANEVEAVRQLLQPGLMDRHSLAVQIGRKRFLLVGETHFRKETVGYFTGLLDDMDGGPLVLLLELPGSIQPAIDRYLASGDEREFDAIWGEVEALPLHDILRWAYANRHRVKGVVAMDEDRTRIFINRALLDDTRNETMANAMLEAAQAHPDARIVAYAGAMHMMLAGRYRFDVDNRQPAGLRLLASGVVRDDVASLSLTGDELPIAAAFAAPTALDLRGAAGLLPYEDFYDYPVYGASRIGELHTHLVYLGALTRQETWVPGAAQSPAVSSNSAE